MALLSKREISVWGPVRRENHIDWAPSVCLAEGYTCALGMSWHFLLDSEGRGVLGRAGGWSWTSGHLGSEAALSDLSWWRRESGSVASAVPGPLAFAEGRLQGEGCAWGPCGLRPAPGLFFPLFCWRQRLCEVVATGIWVFSLAESTACTLCGFLFLFIQEWFNCLLKI